MSAAVATPRKAPPQSDTIRNVETFAAGSYPGDEEGETWEYSDTDIAAIARNFVALSSGANPTHRVPVVVTHDGTHAAAWVRAARDDGELLFTDWQDVDENLARDIKDKRLLKVSAEIKKDFTDKDGRVTPGPYLYRVAVLGADVPRVKGLADIPANKFADSAPGRSFVREFCGGEGGKPGPCPEGGSDGDGDYEHGEHARDIAPKHAALQAKSAALKEKTAALKKMIEDHKAELESHKDDLGQHSEDRHEAFNAVKEKATEASDAADAHVESMNKENINFIAWDSDVDGDAFGNVESAVSDYDPDWSAKDRFEQLQSIEAEAKAAMAVKQKPQPATADNDAFTAEDIAANQKHFKEIITKARAAREQLKTHVKHRKEMKAIKEGDAGPEKYEDSPREETIMDKDSALQMLTDAGVDPAVLASVPDDALIAIATVWQANQGDDDMIPDDVQLDDAIDRPRVKPRADPFADPFEEQVRAPAQQPAQPQRPQPKRTVSIRQFSDPRQITRFVAREVARQVARGTQTITAAAQKEAAAREARAAEERAGSVRLFCDRQATGGKLSPADNDEGSPLSVRSRLLRLAVQPQTVHTFADPTTKKETAKTELQLQQEEIERREVRRFSERIKSGSDSSSDGPLDFNAKVDAHYKRQMERLDKQHAVRN